MSSIAGPIEDASVLMSTDVMGRVIDQTRADGEVINFSYDPNGNTTGLTPPGKPTHAFTYNEVNNVSSYEAPDAGGGTSPDAMLTTYRLDRKPETTTLPDGRTIERTYRTDGKLDTIVTPDGVYQYAYNATTGQIASITTPQGQALAQTLDGELLSAVTWSGATSDVQGSVSYGYNNFFELVSLSINGSPVASFTYDLDGLIMSAGAMTMMRDAASGQLTGTTLSNVTTAHTYNEFGEPATFAVQTGGSDLYGYQVTERDKLGRIVQRDETVEGVATHYAYAYDLAGRLTDVWTDALLTAHYEFDAKGPRMRKAIGLVLRGIDRIVRT